jgi:putative ABC transport system substrate-binding protein
MRRREFVTLLGGAAAAWPIMARAQRPEIPVVAFLNGGSPDGYAPMVAAFHQGLKDTGYVEAQSVRISNGLLVCTTASSNGSNSCSPASFFS